VANVLGKHATRSAALPAADVKNFGVTIKKSLAFPLMVSPSIRPMGATTLPSSHNYSLININDALLRVRGVATWRNLVGPDYSIRIWRNPDVRLGSA